MSVVSGKAPQKEPMTHSLRLGGRRIPLPRSRPLRIALGVVMIVAGCFGFLPILGFWMIPFGLLILSVDIPAVRRFRRRLEIRWARWRQKRQGKPPVRARNASVARDDA